MHLLWTLGRVSVCSVSVLTAVASCACAQSGAQDASIKTTSGTADQEDAVRYEGKTIAEWIREWDANQYQSNQKAMNALVAMGPPAVDELTKLIEQRHRHSGYMIQTLAKMGERARPALPSLLKLAADEKAANPDGWLRNVSLRSLLFMEAGNMSWAADEWIPVLERVAKNAAEPEYERQRAVDAFGKLGPAAVPILKQLAANPDHAIRKSANDALASAAVAAGGSKAEFYETIIDRNPLDANMPDYLISMQGRYNNEKPNPVAQRVKSTLRRHLKEKPDAEVAFALATIIQNGLMNTDLQFAAPTDSYRSQYGREDPAESYITLAEALEIAVEHAPKGSDLALRSGRAMARLRLLAGDWDGMNRALEKIGQQPIPNELRAKLPAPPPDWSNLRKDWPTDNPDMQLGTAAIELEFEKDGKGFAGAHVLIKRRPPQGADRRLGIRADTLLMATQPLEELSHTAFGYYATDRAQTRYAVTDASGKIRIENLPAIPIVVEALIPTSNFPEAARKWDLLMETAPGEIRRTWIEVSSARGSRPSIREVPRPNGRPQLEQVSRTEGPTIVELKAGETIKYPKFIVRTQLMLNLADWASVDANEFVLWWGAVSGEEKFDHYEVEMMLTAPQQSPNSLPSQRAIRSTIVESLDTHWNVGRDGVGGQRLRPGNIYMFEVRAVDRDKNVLARLPATRVWVPWTHRKSQPPDHEPGGITKVPIYDKVGWQSSSQVNDGPRVNVREKVAQFLASDPDGFELEYVLLGRAWLQCLDGNVLAGRNELQQLVQTLPEGNVARGTARALLKQLAGGEELPKRLDFVEDE